jgi:hypothetical protein
MSNRQGPFLGLLLRFVEVLETGLDGEKRPVFRGSLWGFAGELSPVTANMTAILHHFS